MEFKITVLPGDGIGPEIMAEALKVLTAVGAKFGHKFRVKSCLIGGAAIDETGEPLPRETVDNCLRADAVLLGAVGGPKWENLPVKQRPEAGLLGIRSALGLYANLRPARLFAPLKAASPLKSELIQDGLDVLVVRELTGDVYFGRRFRSEDGNTAMDEMCYSVHEIERIARRAFECAKLRSGKVTSVDKANVLTTSRLWRQVVTRVHDEEYPDVQLSHLYVDNAAMQLVVNPARFDVILTSNLFGDILSDEASMITGSIGMLPSASLGAGPLGLYEPIHGSAPDIAGKGIANPLATILSVAMMLRHSLRLEDEARAVEDAVNAALESGLRTKDLGGGDRSASCEEMGDAVMGHLTGGN